MNYTLREKERDPRLISSSRNPPSWQNVIFDAKRLSQIQIGYAEVVASRHITLPPFDEFGTVRNAAMQPKIAWNIDTSRRLTTNPQDCTGASPFTLRCVGAETTLPKTRSMESASSVRGGCRSVR